MKIDYKDCLSYITRKLHIDLFPYQEEMLRAFCEGYNVRTSRGIGRSLVVDCLGKYVTHILDKNDCNIEPDIEFTSECAIKHKLLTPEAARKMNRDDADKSYD